MTHPRNPYPTVDAVIEIAGGIVLIERKGEPRGWALPGGFLDYGEDPADGARREVMEETGLEVHLTELLGVYGAPDRDPRQHNVSIVYVGTADGEPVGGDDAKQARVFALDALPHPLCFDHAQIITDNRHFRATGERARPAQPRGGPSVKDRMTLLAAARDAIEAEVIGRAPVQKPGEDSPWLRELGASFVTLRTEELELRGCIGELDAHRSLIDSVRGCAVGAATRDPRFPPVEREELEHLRIGVSVLTPAHPVRGPEGIEIGRHGILIELGRQRGVLLPEVATDQGWDAETFLAQGCRKAGLSADAWRDPATKISVFETVKLSEPS